MNSKPVPKRSSAWDLAVDVSVKDDRGLKVSIFGETKRGKTRTACTFPKPLLLIGTEDGTKSVRNVPGIKFVPLRSSEHLMELVESAPEVTGPKMMPAGFHGHKGYKTLVLDTGGGYQNFVIMREVLGLEEMPMGHRGWMIGTVTQEQWGVCNNRFAEYMSKFFDLSDRHGINTVCIAHERVFKGKDSGRESEVIAPQAGPALSPGACSWLSGAVDYIFQNFIRRDFVMKAGTKIVGSKELPKPVKQFTGKMQFCLRVGPDENYMTGSRLLDGMPMPECLILGRTGEPAKQSAWEQITAMIAGKSPETAVK